MEMEMDKAKESGGKQQSACPRNLSLIQPKSRDERR